MSWRTAGLAGQVFDGPVCYLPHWDMGFLAEIKRIAALQGVTARREALKQIEARTSRAMRVRYERALTQVWKGR